MKRVNSDIELPMDYEEQQEGEESNFIKTK